MDVLLTQFKALSATFELCISLTDPTHLCEERKLLVHAYVNMLRNLSGRYLYGARFVFPTISFTPLTLLPEQNVTLYRTVEAHLRDLYVKAETSLGRMKVSTDVNKAQAGKEQYALLMRDGLKGLVKIGYQLDLEVTNLIIDLQLGIQIDV